MNTNNATNGLSEEMKSILRHFKATNDAHLRTTFQITIDPSTWTPTTSLADYSPIHYDLIHSVRILTDDVTATFRVKDIELPLESVRNFPKISYPWFARHVTFESNHELPQRITLELDVTKFNPDMLREYRFDYDAFARMWEESIV